MSESIEAVISSRIDKLAPRVRTLLRYAAVIGPSFSLDLLERVLPDEDPDAQGAATWNRLTEFIK